MLKRCLLFSVIVIMAFACSKKPVNQSNPYAQQGPSTLNPEEKQNYSGKRPEKKGFFLFAWFKKKPKGKYERLVDEYYDRMEQNAKEARKKEKEMQKPQYSDPLYFGHKKKPKKRPPGKMKYCKVCGIKH